ncbi:MAG: hypothetical protein M0P66_17475 [Salinivirgaceae bacterium]|nr:hypothetical protein [Salinivirgaceae bacterium]
MKKVIISILFLIFSGLLSAQDSTNTYSKWYIKPAAGINIPITNLLSNEIPDNLFEYDDNSYYWQILSASYFFSSKWGLEFTFQAGHSQSISGRAERFNQDLEEKYGENYFVTASSGAQFDNFSLIGGSIQRGNLGIVYRYEKRKYIFMPKLSIGVTSFYTDWGEADLKEKGTNTVYKLSYDSGKRPNDHFTIAPSFTFGYRLSNRIIANIDILYSYYKTDIEFVEEIRNTFTNEIVTETIDYKKNIHTLTVGFGVIIELKPAPNNVYTK